MESPFKKTNSILMAVAIAAVAVLFSFMFYRRSSYKDQFNQMKANVQAGLDSNMANIQRANAFYKNLEERIAANDTTSAIKIMDSLIAERPFTYKLYYYRGLIKEQQNQLDSAIYFYSYAIMKGGTPISLVRRGGLLLKTNKIKEGLNDYREAYNLNYDYSFDLGMAFQKLKMKDSALLYYSIYKEYYPSDSNVAKAIESLKEH